MNYKDLIQLVPNYWILEPLARDDVRKAAGTVAIHGLRRYRVTGTFEYTLYGECGCPNCRGNCVPCGQKVKTSIVVAAANEEAALRTGEREVWLNIQSIDKVTDWTTNRMDEDDFDWADDVVVEEVSDD